MLLGGGEPEGGWAAQLRGHGAKDPPQEPWPSPGSPVLRPALESLGVIFWPLRMKLITVIIPFSSLSLHEAMFLGVSTNYPAREGPSGIQPVQ